MKNSNLGTLVRFLPLGLGLSLVVAACGGTDTNSGNKSTGGTTSTGATTSTGGTTSATAGSSGKAGSTSTGHAGGTSTGSGGGSGGDFMTGLPADKPLSSLTDAEAMQLCSSFEDYFTNSLQDLDCRLSGLLAAAFAQADTDAKAQAACKAAYDMCAAAPAMPTTDMCSKPTGMCTATVGELEACASDDKAVFAQLGMSFPACADLTLKDLMGTPGGDTAPPMEPASCTALDMKCPGGPMPPSAMMMP